MREDIVIIFHIYGDLVIFLLFCNQQCTESESREIKISAAEPISNKKNIKVSMGKPYSYHTR